jgi:acetyl esterase/lipase
MPIDRHAQRFLEMLAAAGQSRGRYGAPEERRSALRNLVRLVDPPGTPIGGARDRLFTVTDGCIALRVYSPEGAPARILPGMLFFHGGGWVAGDLETHDGTCRRLANATGCRVVAVDYRLAPEHPFPHGLNDCFAATRHVAARARDFGIDPARLGVAGDSVGGGFAASVCRMARDAGGPVIAFQLLLCPILDIFAQSRSRAELQQGYFLDRATMERDLELYLPPDADRRDPRLSPLQARDFAGLPPAYIHTAQFDPFCDEGEGYARRLGEAGVAVQGQCHPGMIHFFSAMPRMIPYARTAMDGIGAQIRHAVKTPRPRERRTQMRARPEAIRA